jgi:hypothetical protein
MRWSPLVHSSIGEELTLQRENTRLKLMPEVQAGGFLCLATLKTEKFVKMRFSKPSGESWPAP